MARCDHCGTVILFGGVREGSRRYCDDDCRQLGQLASAADEVPPEMFEKYLLEVHEGTCPKCGGEGPVDVHTSHRIWSALVLTSCNSNPEVCCRSCGREAKLLALVTAGLFGWWGFPFGILMTPLQIARNIYGLAVSADPTRPSDALRQIVRMQVAGQVRQAALAAPTSEPPGESRAEDQPDPWNM